MSDETRPDIVRDVPGQDLAPDVREAWLTDAADGFRQNGVVVLRGAIPQPRVAAVLQALKGRQLKGDEADDRPFQPAPLRPRIAVPLEGPLADPALFAPPTALALAKRLLGEETIIGELGLVASRPGDGPREPRRAAIPLFGGLDVESDVPSAAVTMLAPLGDVGPGVGFPEYWVGSHRAHGRAVDTATAPFRPVLEAGSIVMSDWRTLYRAGANTTGATTLGLYVSFQRKWLLSLSGSEYKPGLRVPAATLDRLPQAYHPLVAWALHRNKTDDVSEFAHLWLGRLVKGLHAAKGG
jgi:hypothetical protein